EHGPGWNAACLFTDKEPHLFIQPSRAGPCFRRRAGGIALRRGGAGGRAENLSESGWLLLHACRASARRVRPASGYPPVLLSISGVLTSAHRGCHLIH